MYLVTQRRIKINNGGISRLLVNVLCVYTLLYWFMTQSTCNDERYGL